MFQALSKCSPSTPWSSTPWFTNPEALQAPFVWNFYGGCLVQAGVTVDLVQAGPPSQGPGSGGEMPRLLIKACLSGDWSPSGSHPGTDSIVWLEQKITPFTWKLQMF